MGMTYARAGVNIDKKNLAIQSLVSQLSKTLRLRKKVGGSLSKTGHFSGLIRLNDTKALAVSTDGVGTKILVAQALRKYDTIGIDLVAMNANDIICVGAEPLTMVDYIAIDDPDPEITREIGKGLAEGARIANISICGGEIAVLPEIVKGFDLIGLAVGIVDIDKIITGEKIKPGDAVIGLESSGIHSNGLTLARKVLLKKHGINEKLFGRRTVGEELLTPTKIYVREIMEVIKKVKIKGLANITGGGLGNLYRITKYGFLIDSLPEPQDIFKVIQKEGRVSEKEMYRTFNMGIGFCIVAAQEDARKVIKICRKNNTGAFIIGKVVKGRGVRIKNFVLGY
ncbi:MAG: phosphoribosylformylglycinamidine cyclo-ligase [Methanobacteriota archaeon]